MDRRASIEIWQEPTGYWSASVVVRMPARPEWRENSTLHHNADQAIEWARSRIHIAVESVSVV